MIVEKTTATATDAVPAPTVVKELAELTFRQKIEAFVKYHSMQVVALFVAIGGVWNLVPDDLKSDLFSEFPFLMKWKTIIYLAAFLLALYKAKMTTQVIQVAPAAPDAHE